MLLQVSNVELIHERKKMGIYIEMKDERKNIKNLAIIDIMI